ncbi:hypothetical protein ACFYW9_19115 [Streptomyces sp. NPDC002698]|uniref:hypothetical protein n=1 Tax=Streptomyces sp. NPDC002698 TaxID=3364660 RepID=UPI0036C1C31E
MRFERDMFNNLRRMCHVRGMDDGRVWQLRTAMRDAHGKRHYLCRNVITGAFQAVAVDRMGNLY